MKEHIRRTCKMLCWTALILCIISGARIQQKQPPKTLPGNKAMSEEHPNYIPCRFGENLHTEYRVRRAGDLIELCIERPPQQLALLTPKDATALAVSINRIATEISRAATT